MALAICVNDFLTAFAGIGIQLVDFKMECGRLFEGDMMRIVVADEISPVVPPVGLKRMRSSTRTASAAKWAVWSKPIPKWQSGSAS